MYAVLIRIFSALCGWAILTIFNFLPLWLEMPVIDRIKVGGYDVNIMEEHTFEEGIFVRYLTENGNLPAGGKLICNDEAAYYTLDETICKLDLVNMESCDLKGKAPAEPNFCDNKYYLSTADTNSVSVGVLGDGSPMAFEEKWYDNTNTWDNVQHSLYQLLARSETEKLTTREMAKLVGYTINGSILGWDGEHAIFYAYDEMKELLLFQFVDETGLANVLPTSCTNPGIVMVSGTTGIYTDGGVLKTFDFESLETKAISDPAYSVKYVNYMMLDGHRILVWVATDGMHTIDLDHGNQNFVKGDWITDYRGLYMWKNHIILLRYDRGFYKWDYTV